MPVSWQSAPAKVNLHLHVVGRRDDGYHLLDSLVVFANVADRLTVSPGRSLSLSISGPYAGALALETENLVLRAARELADRVGVKATGHIQLEKNLPIAAGLGGGSSNAAATLKLMMRHWDILPDPGDIRAVALRLGADVPVCLLGRTIRMSGIGHELDLSHPVPDIGLVLVNPGVPLSTPAVFAAREGEFSVPAVFPDKGWGTAQELVDSLAPTRNDLEAAACQLVPAIRDVLDAIGALPDCMMARMTGSGATCFGIFPAAVAAAEAAHAVSTPGWWVWGGGVRGRAWDIALRDA